MALLQLLRFNYEKTWNIVVKMVKQRITVSYRSLCSVPPHTPTFVRGRVHLFRRLNISSLFHPVMARDYILANQVQAEACGHFRMTIRRGCNLPPLPPSCCLGCVMTEGEQPNWSVRTKATPEGLHTESAKVSRLGAAAGTSLNCQLMDSLSHESWKHVSFQTHGYFGLLFYNKPCAILAEREGDEKSLGNFLLCLRGINE